ncbi:MAG: hypothetical protein K2Y39_20030, partial [Candidatus Obscuribacterales bacterium]|nr:hypothetical protein [Candidatus Obscuribacterales bacterium]
HKMGYTQTPAAFAGRTPPTTAEEEGRWFLEAMLVFLQLIPQYFESEEKQLRRFRFHVINAHRWFLFGHSYYSKCMKAKSLGEAEDTRLFSSEPSRAAPFKGDRKNTKDQAPLRRLVR